MPDVLAEIVAVKRRDLTEREAEQPIAALKRRALSQSPPRDFRRALEARAEQSQLALIAEIKKASPSRGLIRADFDPPSLAQAYQQGGAACLSVLTDRPYFQGEDAQLTAARAAVDLPVLRKDFMLEHYQIVESRALGADCILLIMACLPLEKAQDLAAHALDLGMTVLAEVHDAAELDAALRLDAALIGINNRNLKSLSVSLDTFEALASEVPAERFLVAESGLYHHSDLLRLQAAGAQAFLIGESLMRQADVRAATRAILGG